MTDTTINPAKNLAGTIVAPSSKSYSQRMLIASLLSEGRSIISNPLSSEDTNATLRAIENLGAKVKISGSKWIVDGSLPLKSKPETIDCGESGATLRFILPVCALARGSSTLTFSKSLEKRPILPLLQSLQDLGVSTETREFCSKPEILVKGGGIRGGKTSIPGDISSQFISGLLFACPLASLDTIIRLNSPLESTHYVEMTKEVLENHNIFITISDNFDQFNIKSDQKYTPNNHIVPGDFSSAAFMLAAAAITNSKITIKNLESSTLQGDKAILNILKNMGVNVRIGNDQVIIAAHKGFLNPIDLDARNIPDLVPICSVLACYANGTSKIHDAHRLRYKESDRLLSLYLELRKMGADILIDTDCLTIGGSRSLHGALVDPHNDHRIAMACSIAGLGAIGATKIKNSECVKKSYPSFFEDLQKLGVVISGGKFNR